MMQRAFTVVEIIITVTIMGILLTLAVVGLTTSQMNARDTKRVADVDTIKNNLESFYVSGIPTSSVPSIVNEIVNPSFETNTTSWSNSAGASVIRSSEQAYIGTYSAKVTPSTSSGNTGIYIAAPGQNGTLYTYSAYVYSTVSQQIALVADGLSSASTTVTVGAAWTKISVSGTRTSANPLYVRAVGTAGTPFYVDGVMVTSGSTTYNYGDGTFPGWSWTGTAQASSSTGPLVKTNAPGTYPSTSLTSSPLIKTNLIDADLKSFMAPGQTDPYATFISATNASQDPTLVSPQPTINQYVYQPIDSKGALCHNYDCRKFNIFYRLEKDNASTVYMTTSKNQ